jgi:hypothetical protein
VGALAIALGVVWLSSCGGRSERHETVRGDFVPLTCEDVGTWSSDLRRCDTSFVHRPAAKACTPPPRDTEGTVPIARDDESTGSTIVVTCTTDLDCGDGAYCLRSFVPEENLISYACQRPSCQADADCGAGKICVCDGFEWKGATLDLTAFGRCAPATCATDADCTGGALCVATLDDDCGSGDTVAKTFRCQSPNDECNANDHCSGWSRCSASSDRFVCRGC